MELENILNESLDLIKNKEFEKALKNLEQIENKNSKVYFLIGSIFLSLKKIDLAENNLLLAYKLNENNYSILNNLGIISNIKGDIKNTKRYFLKAIRIEENIETLSEIGRIYKQEKDFGEKLFSKTSGATWFIDKPSRYSYLKLSFINLILIKFLNLICSSE